MSYNTSSSLSGRREWYQTQQLSVEREVMEVIEAPSPELFNNRLDK